MKCRRCGTYFDYDKTYGICPKCVAYNRPDGAEREEKWGGWSGTDYHPPVLSGSMEELYGELYSKDAAGRKKHRKHTGSGKKNGAAGSDKNAGKSKSAGMNASRQKISGQGASGRNTSRPNAPAGRAEFSRHPRKRKRLLWAAIFVILFLAVGSALSTYKQLEREKTYSWEDYLGEVDYGEADVSYEEHENVDGGDGFGSNREAVETEALSMEETETEGFQPAGNSVSLEDQKLTLTFYEPVVFDTAKTRSALGEGYVLVGYPISSDLAVENDYDERQLQIYLKSGEFYHYPVYPFQLEEAGIDVPWCETASSLSYGEDIYLCFAVREEEADQRQLLVQFQEPAEKEGYYRTVSQYLVDCETTPSFTSQELGTQPEAMQCHDPELTFVEETGTTRQYRLSQEFTAPWDRVIYLFEMVPFAEDAEGLGEVKIQEPVLDYEDEFYLEKLPILPCGVSGIVELDLEVSVGVKQIALYLSNSEEEFQWKLTLP